MPRLTTGDGVTLAYNDWGAGRPLVLLGTAVMGARAWEFQAAFFARHGMRVVTYDRRGCGRSDWPWQGYDYDTLADDLAALSEHLDLREATLVGCAAGAGEAVRYLTRHGCDRVSRLVLVSPTTPFMMRADDNPGGIDLAVFEEVAHAIDADRAAWAAALVTPFFAGAGAGPLPVSPELARWMADLALDSSPHATREIYRTLFTTDQRAETAKISLPTLVVHGEKDVAAPIDLCGRRTAELIPGSTFLRYEDASHGLFVSHAERLNKDIVSFLEG